jgi:hypothetical protein
MTKKRSGAQSVITQTPLVSANHIKPLLVRRKFLSHADFKREGEKKK